MVACAAPPFSVILNVAMAFDTLFIPSAAVGAQVEEARRRRSQSQASHTKPSVQFRSSSIAGNDGTEGAEVRSITPRLSILLVR